MYFVRTASRQDLPAIESLLKETWHATYDAHHGPEKVAAIVQVWHSRARLEAQLDQPNSEFLVADNGQHIAGVAFAFMEEEKTVKLSKLYVMPQMQGQKIGLHLLIEVENSFPEAERVVLEVDENNTAAIGFYERYGFKRNGRTENCSEAGSGLPALIMEKSIQWADEDNDDSDILVGRTNPTAWY